MTKQLTFEEVVEAVNKHISERHWDKNPPRGLAISIALEANELLEHYQWQDEPVGGKKEVAEELADILIYSIQIARHYNIDISAEIMKKLEKSAKKYPLEKFSSTDKAVQKQAWLEIKKNHKKDTLL